MQEQGIFSLSYANLNYSFILSKFYFKFPYHSLYLLQTKERMLKQNRL
jgi:hypothetical protein